jgi:heme-degrading monooxygenase HmoA
MYTRIADGTGVGKTTVRGGAGGRTEMIARIWRGRVPAAKADAYLDYLLATGLKDYGATPGNRGVWALRRIEGEVAEFVTLTFWDSMDAVRAFAGEDVERAVYYPEDDEYLLEKEPRVEHYEVAYGMG